MTPSDERIDAGIMASLTISRQEAELARLRALSEGDHRQVLLFVEYLNNGGVLMCADHDGDHPARLICKDGWIPMCGDAHVGHDCSCDYSELPVVEAANE